MKKVMLVLMMAVVIFACNKKEPVKEEVAMTAAKVSPASDCEKEVICDRPVKAGETGIVLPTGTKLCFVLGSEMIRVELPYQGYTVLKISYTGTKDAFFNDPAIQKEISAIKYEGGYSKQSLYGISFYIVTDEKIFLPKAACDCEGIQAFKLKVLSIPLMPKIYICDGSCMVAN